MSDAEDIKTLAEALMQRARRLADEEMQLAEHERERLLDAARERVAQRRQQAEKQAGQLAQRHYRQLVQRAEQDIRAKLERLRWTLIEAVLAELKTSLESLHREPERYREVLRDLLREAGSALPQAHLTAQLNDRDHAAFHATWQELQPKGEGAAEIALSDQRCNCSGGVLLTTPNQDIRLDQTFEARQERLAALLARDIDRVLFGTPQDDEVTHHAG